MKRWGKATFMAAIAITIAVGTAFATQWLGTGGNDEMQMYAGVDLIHTGDDNDTIQMSNGDDTFGMGEGADTIMMYNGNDTINFFDGTADLIFHGTNATPSGHPVYMEYTEADEVLTVYAYTDFVVQLGN